MDAVNFYLNQAQGNVQPIQAPIQIQRRQLVKSEGCWDGVVEFVKNIIAKIYLAFKGCTFLQACETGNELAIRAHLHAGSKIEGDKTPLEVAFEKKQFNACMHLLELGVDSTFLHNSVLIWAIQRANDPGYKEFALALIESQLSLKCIEGDELNHCCLKQTDIFDALVAKLGSAQVLGALVAGSHDNSICGLLDEKLFLPVMLKDDQFLHSLALQKCPIALRRVAMLKGQGCLEKHDLGGRSVLHAAMEAYAADRSNERAKVVLEVLGLGAKNEMIPGSGSLLNYALENDFPQDIVLKLIAENNLLLGEANNVGRTALHLAIGDTDIVNALVQNGASIDAQDNQGNTPLHLAVIQKKRTSFFAILNSQPQQIDAVNGQGRTAIQLAILGNKPTWVRPLLENGSTPNQVDGGGNSLLHLAVTVGSLTIVEALLAKEANVNKVNGEGRSPLHIACAMGRYDMVPKLVAAGAICEFEDGQGRKPIELLPPSAPHDVKKILKKAYEAQVVGNNKQSVGDKLKSFFNLKT